MIFRLTVLLMLFSGALAAQPPNWYMTEDVLLHINPQSQLFINGSAKIQGTINNQGLINLASHLESNSKSNLGNLKVSGRDDQQIVGDTVEINTLEIEKDNNFDLELTSLLIQEGLILNSGVVRTLESDLNILSGIIEGGSADSFIEGSIKQTSHGDRLHYPLGLDGFFNSLQLSQLPQNAITEVTLQLPEIDRLNPNDSLTGVADEVEWVIKYQGLDTVTHALIDFNGLDLLGTPNFNAIRAFRYSPVIAIYVDSLNLYRPLGVNELSDTDSLTFGLISTLEPIRLKEGEPTFLSMARMPVSTGLFFYVPNVFSPNSLDLNNSMFRPYLEGTEIEGVNMIIWDSFNNQVHQVVEQNPDLNLVGWDGYTPEGNPASQGVYFYSIKLSTAAGLFEKSGSFLLIL